MAVAWVVSAIVFAIVEVATVAFYAAFLALGAAAAAIAAALGFGPVVQALTFFVLAVAGIVTVRPLLIRRRRPRLESGAAGMIGQTAVVVDGIAGQHPAGHVRIAGESWPAVGVDDAPIAKGATVWVVEIRGSTLVVHQ
ncbi:MAG: NfeD family protein [Candidatus Dormibacteraeota bacterium]|nr:NfeD family protein [Candidatus Dormibacteraeota bacterium]